MVLLFGMLNGFLIIGGLLLPRLAALYFSYKKIVYEYLLITDTIYYIILIVLSLLLLKDNMLEMIISLSYYGILSVIPFIVVTIIYVVKTRR